MSCSVGYCVRVSDEIGEKLFVRLAARWGLRRVFEDWALIAYTGSRKEVYNHGIIAIMSRGELMYLYCPNDYMAELMLGKGVPPRRLAEMYVSATKIYVTRCGESACTWVEAPRSVIRNIVSDLIFHPERLNWCIVEKKVEWGTEMQVYMWYRSGPPLWFIMGTGSVGSEKPPAPPPPNCVRPPESTRFEEYGAE